MKTKLLQLLASGTPQGDPGFSSIVANSRRPETPKSVPTSSQNITADQTSLKQDAKVNSQEPVKFSRLQHPQLLF